MASFLDEYGVVDARRTKRRIWIIVGVLLAAVLGTVGYVFFQNWGEERTMDRFLALLKAKDYQAAYQMWDKPDTHRAYPFDRFAEDWSANGIYKNPDAIKVTNVDNCEAGVVFTVTYPSEDPAGVWIERDTKKMSFYGEARCHGRHLQIKQYLKSLFGGS